MTSGDQQESANLTMFYPPQPVVDGANKSFACRQPLLRGEAGDAGGGRLLPFDYMEDGLKIRAEFVDVVREAATVGMLEKKKLLLVLDLDHTLLHSVGFFDTDVKHDPGRGLFELIDVGCVTKLRPRVHEFLRSASALFDLCVYTMSDREYAREMARLLDHNSEYFHHKVITRSDCREAGKKGLDIVLADPCTVVVLDDTLSVWGKNSKNLVNVKRYSFPPFGRKKGKREDDCCDDSTALVDVYGLLERIHREYFEDGGGGGGGRMDVRNVMKKIRRRALGECHIAFAGGTTDVFRLHDMAERLGAVCSPAVTSPEVTHVVCCGSEWTDHADWGRTNGKFLVTVKWLEDAYFIWRRPRERDYSPLAT